MPSKIDLCTILVREKVFCMFKHPYKAIVFSSVLAATAFGGVAQAKNFSLGSPQRVAAARAHLEAVCRPLEAKENYRAAARCFTNVADYLSRSTALLVSPFPPRPIAVSATPLEPWYGVSRPYLRRSSSLLASNYVLLGVGF